MAIMMAKLYAALTAAAEPRDAINDIRSTLKVQTWALSFNTVMLVALIAKAFLGGR